MYTTLHTRMLRARTLKQLGLTHRAVRAAYDANQISQIQFRSLCLLSDNCFDIIQYLRP